MTTSWTQVSSELARSANEKRIPFSLSFELTARCNQQCKMCYVCKPAHDRSAKEKELSALQWLTLAKEARDAGLFWVTLTGGEIFLREDFKEIYSGILELGLMVQIFTNGTLITPEMVKWLKTMPPYKISITLYGANSETCRQITGYKESYQRTVGVIDSLLEAGIPTEVKTTVVRANMHEFDQMCDFAIQRRVMLGVVNYISPRREGMAGDPVGSRLIPEERIIYENKMNEHNAKMFKQSSETTVKVTDSVAEGEMTKLRLNADRRDANDAFDCTAGKSSAWITWDGRLTPCGLMSEPCAYPLETGFLKAWRSIKDECMKVPMCSECSTCKYIAFCERCPARLFTETGFCDKPAPYLCDIAKLRYAQAIQDNRG